MRTDIIMATAAPAGDYGSLDANSINQRRTITGAQHFCEPARFRIAIWLGFRVQRATVAASMPSMGQRFTHLDLLRQGHLETQKTTCKQECLTPEVFLH
jgi:hypothetical protein